METKKLLYDTKDLREILNIGIKKVYEVVNRDDFPKPVMFGNKRLWKKTEIEKWVRGA